MNLHIYDKGAIALPHTVRQSSRLQRHRLGLFMVHVDPTKKSISRHNFSYFQLDLTSPYSMIRDNSLKKGVSLILSENS